MVLRVPSSSPRPCGRDAASGAGGLAFLLLLEKSADIFLDI